MGHKRLALVCEGCGETKPGRYFKRLTDSSGYKTVCRACEGDKLKQKVCCNCGEMKSLVLGFVPLKPVPPSKVTTYTDECRVCRRIFKDSLKLDTETVLLHKARSNADYYHTVVKPKREAAKAVKETKPIAGWPWAYRSNNEVPS